jgi:hypothetical protein
MKSSKSVFSHASGEVARLSGQDFFKPDQAVVDDLVNAIIEAADDIAHITRMVTAWKYRTSAMMHVKDVSEIAAKTRKLDAGPEHCPICAGGDWVSFKKMVAPGGVEPYEAEYSARCNCARGRWLLQKEREEKRREMAHAAG